MSQIRLRQSQAGERLGPADGKYVVEGVMQEQLKQVRTLYIHSILSAKHQQLHWTERTDEFDHKIDQRTIDYRKT